MDHNQDRTRLLTTAEAAEYIGSTAQTLEGWRARRKGPRFVKPSAKFVRYRIADLDEWAAQHLTDPAA